MTVLRRRSRLPGQPRQLDAGRLEPLIGSFALHLAAEGKAARTVQGYTAAVRWFAAGYLAGEAGKTSWECSRRGSLACGAVTSTCGSGRKRSAERAARTGSS